MERNDQKWLHQNLANTEGIFVVVGYQVDYDKVWRDKPTIYYRALTYFSKELAEYGKQDLESFGFTYLTTLEQTRN